MSVQQSIMKVIVVLFLASILFVANICEHESPRIILKGIQCNVSEKFIDKNFSCYVKSYGRVTTLNVAGKSKMPLSSLLVSFYSSFPSAMV